VTPSPQVPPARRLTAPRGTGCIQALTPTLTAGHVSRPQVPRTRISMPPCPLPFGPPCRSCSSSAPAGWRSDRIPPGGRVSATGGRSCTTPSPLPPRSLPLIAQVPGGLGAGGSWNPAPHECFPPVFTRGREHGRCAGRPGRGRPPVSGLRSPVSGLVRPWRCWAQWVTGRSQSSASLDSIRHRPVVHPGADRAIRPLRIGYGSLTSWWRGGELVMMGT
jgi:hypothetical protein